MIEVEDLHKRYRQLKAVTLLDPDSRQGNQPLFGSAIAVLALYVVVLAAVTLAIERDRDVSA